MFKQFKSIDESFQQTRRISLVAVVLLGITSVLAIWSGYQQAAKGQKRIYILVNGRAFQALASDPKEHLEIECRWHIRNFHELFFHLDPDEKQINTNMHRAFYLADGSAKALYDNMRESGYISGLISGNVSQSVSVDSIWLNLNSEPYGFKCWAKETLLRSTVITSRNLITQGYLRQVDRSDDNEHGLLIEQFEVLDNTDLKTKNR